MSTSIYSEDTEEEDRTAETDDESGDNEENKDEDEENKDEDEENKDEDEENKDEDEENKDEENEDEENKDETEIEPFGVCCFCGDGCNPSSQACGSCMRSCWTRPAESAEVLPSCKKQRC